MAVHESHRRLTPAGDRVSMARQAQRATVRVLLLGEVRRVVVGAGSRIAISNAMMEITTRSSMSVNARRLYKAR